MMISLRINDECNFACKYCFNHLNDQTGKHMSRQTADRTLQYCLKNDINRISIPQKEPTTTPELLSHIIESYAYSNVYVTNITTNGYALSDDLLELFASHDIHLLVSYDGLWHDEYRRHLDGSSTEERVRDNLFKLKDAKIPFGVATCIFHGVTDKIAMNYDYINLITSAIAFNFDVSSALSVQNCDLQSIADAFSYISHRNNGLKTFPLNKISQRLQSNAHYSNHMCGAGRGSYTVNWDGKIYPCYHVPAWKEMNICLGDVNYGLSMREKDKFKQYDTSQPNKCNKCDAALCGICYTASHDVSGDMLRPIPINCQIFNELTNIVKERLN